MVVIIEVILIQVMGFALMFFLGTFCVQGFANLSGKETKGFHRVTMSTLM